MGLVAALPPLPSLGDPSTLGTSSPMSLAPESRVRRPSPRKPPGAIPAGRGRVGVRIVLVFEAPGGGGRYGGAAGPGGAVAVGGVAGKEERLRRREGGGTGIRRPFPGRHLAKTRSKTRATPALHPPEVHCGVARSPPLVLSTCGRSVAKKNGRRRPPSSSSQSYCLLNFRQERKAFAENHRRGGPPRHRRRHHRQQLSLRIHTPLERTYIPFLFISRTRYRRKAAESQETTFLLGPLSERRNGWRWERCFSLPI